MVTEQKKGMLLNVAKYATQTLSLKGDFAELGVFRGDSAEILCKTKREKTLHLFDTFKGLPRDAFDHLDTNTKFAREHLAPEFYSCPIEAVKKRLKPYKDVFFYQGIFPATTDAVKDKEFCFVHLDADLYYSIYMGIDFFYPRLVKDGVLLIHNYNDFDGVTFAVHHFFSKSEVKEVGFKHCLITKK